MSRFHYQALNADQQLVAGELEADSVAAAIEQLEASGLEVQSIGFSKGEAPPHSQARSAASPSKYAVPSAYEEEHNAMLRAYLARALERAKPLTPALLAYAAELPAGRRRQAMSELCRLVDHGDVAAAERAFDEAPELWAPLIAGAAQTSDNSQLLNKFIAESNQIDQSRQHWWRLLAYPLFLIGCALLVLLLLAVMVVPTFQSVFRDFGLELPLLTVWIISVSEWLAATRHLVLLAIALLALAAAVRVAGPKLGEFFGAWFGRSTSLAIFAGSAGDLLAGGVLLSDALRIAGRAASAAPIRRASRRLALLLDRGNVAAATPLQKPLSATVVLAATAPMTEIARAKLFQTIGECYADRSRSTLSWSQGLFGPLTIFAVGFVVALVALSLFLPLVDLINNLSG